MNILIIPSFIYNSHDPTLGSFVFEQAVALRRQGHRVFLAFVDTYSIIEFGYWANYSEKNEIKEGIPVYRKRAFCLLKHGSGFYGCHERFAKEIIALYRQYLSDKQIEIIHAHCCAWAGYAAMKLSEKTGIPYVITEHSTLYSLQSHRIQGKSKTNIIRSFSGAKRVICVSSALQQCIAPYCSDTVELGNVVDCDMFSPSESQNVFSGPVFLTVLYMKTQDQLNKKGMDLLIDAFSNVVQQYPEAQLWIGGDGPAKEDVKSWIVERKLERNVVMLGALSRQEVAEQMRQCDVFVLPSRYETFGVVYAEAMACGKPVIATRTGGPDSFVTKDTGLLIDVGNQKKLTEAMLYMAENYQNYNSGKIREYVVQRFSMEAIGEQLTEIYKECF